MTNPKTDENTSTENDPAIESNVATQESQSNPSDVNVDDIQKELESWKKRQGDSKTFINELQATIKAKDSELLESKKATLPSSEDEIKALAKENPKLVDAITRMISENSLDVQEDIRKQISDVRKVQENLQAEQGFKEVLEAHPDATKIRDSDGFRNWLDTQPADVKAIPFNKDSSPQMIKLLFDNYKQDKSITQTIEDNKKSTKQEQIDNSKSVSSNNKVTIDGDGSVITYDEAKVKFKTKDGKTDWGKIRAMANKGQLVVN